MHADVVWLWGVPFASLTLAGTTTAIAELVEAGRPSLIITANTHYVMITEEHPELREINAAAALILADGAPVVWASRWAGTPLPERVAGSDLIFELSRMAAARGYRLFFLGGAEGIADEAARRLAALPGPSSRGHPVSAIRGMDPRGGAGNHRPHPFVGRGYLDDRLHDAARGALALGAARCLGGTRRDQRRGRPGLRRGADPEGPSVDAEDRPGMGVPPGAGAEAALPSICPQWLVPRPECGRGAVTKPPARGPRPIAASKRTGSPVLPRLSFCRVGPPSPNQGPVHGTPQRLQSRMRLAATPPMTDLQWLIDHRVLRTRVGSQHTNRFASLFFGASCP